ncbi:MAG: type II secretion system protein [bacterium]
MIRNNNKNKTEKNTNQKRGFTLIEVMVSVSLFAMVMTLSLGAILSIVDGNKKAQAINAVANNLNFAVESMVRDIKTGYAYTCTVNVISASTTSNLSGDNGCTPNTSFFSISLVSTITGEKRGVRYYREVTDGKGRIWKETRTGSEVVSQYPLTSPEVDIKDLKFVVSNPISANYTGQPSVFLTMNGTANVNPTQTSDFTVQTYISQRNLNLPK